MNTQLNLLQLMPPAATIMVHEDHVDGLMPGTIGLRSTCYWAQRRTDHRESMARNCGWMPDPQGEYFLVSWQRPPRNTDCGVYVHESVLLECLHAGQPFDPNPGAKARWESLMKQSRRRKPDDDEADDEEVA